MQVIDQINGSALFAQSAYSASVATKDSLGRDITSTYLTGIDLSNYYTKDETSGAEQIAQAIADIPVGDPEVNAYVFNNSASIDESKSLVESNSSFWNDISSYQINSANYITEHQSLKGLMSASLLESADGKWTAYNSIPFKAGDEFPASADAAIQCVQSNSSNWQSVSNKLDTNVFTAWSANQASNNYQLSAGDGISIIDDDVNKITRIDVTAGGGTGGDMFTAYLEYNDQNQISGYNGSAFAGQGGGGDVPTGTMNVTGLEYNAVNEISGYNGSAIAQYGAEKQWLVHDDTLVHLSNSAQYALGCNVSALQRLMGIDETVLYEDSVGIASSASTAQLSEPIENFKFVDFYIQGMYRPNPVVNRFLVDNTQGYRNEVISIDGGSTYNWVTNITSNNTTLGFARSVMFTQTWTGTNRVYSDPSSTGSMQCSLIKVVGIGRKA